jgi:asparagine synthase (glutamine-hydrolysing)
MTPCSGFFGLLRPASASLVAPVDLGSLPAMRASHSGALTGGAWGGPGRGGDWFHAGRHSVAFHGEIFNASDLRRQLDLAAQTPLLHLLLTGWQRWREPLFERLDGLFALAVRDGDDVVLYRDPSGLCGLYCYHAAEGGIAFATDLDVLLRLPGTQRRLARRSLHEYLRFLEVTAPNTFFENMRTVEAGQALHWPARDGGVPTGPQAGRVKQEALPANFADAVAMLDEHLRRSVQSRLAGTHRPAAFLSGGVDSALLCAIAAGQQEGIAAVTVGFDTAAHDEAPAAQRIALNLGLRHEVLRFSREDYLDAFERFSRDAEQPMADPTSLATLMVSEHCQGRHDIVLDGTGADEAVGMMPPRHVRLAVRSADLLPARARRSMGRFMRAMPGLAGFAPILDFEHPADTMIRWDGFRRNEIEALCGEPVSFAHTTFYSTFDRHQDASPFELYSALVDAMPGDRLTQAMRMSGVRMGFPFYERQTDRFLRALPTDYRYAAGEPKRILRALLAQYVPTEIWSGPKRGFTFPVHAFLAADNHRLVRRYLDEGPWLAATGLAHGKVQDYARQFIAGDRRLSFRIWALVVLAAWLEQHGNSN